MREKRKDWENKEVASVEERGKEIQKLREIEKEIQEIKPKG